MDGWSGRGKISTISKCTHTHTEACHQARVKRRWAGNGWADVARTPHPKRVRRLVTRLYTRVWSVLWHVFTRRGDVRGVCVTRMPGWNCLSVCKLVTSSAAVDNVAVHFPICFRSAGAFFSSFFFLFSVSLSLIVSSIPPLIRFTRSPPVFFCLWHEKGGGSLMEEKSASGEAEGDHGKRWSDTEGKEMWTLWDKEVGEYMGERGRERERQAAR